MTKISRRDSVFPVQLHDSTSNFQFSRRIILLKMNENPQITLSRANLDKFYDIMQHEVGMDSLDQVIFESCVERAFGVTLPDR